MSARRNWKPRGRIIEFALLPREKVARHAPDEGTERNR
jgi:hypothetical protein